MGESGSSAAAPERPDSDPPAAHRPWWATRSAIAFWAVLGVYVLVTFGVIFQSPILRLDTDLFKMDLRHRYPEWKPWIHLAVMFGQRGPATLVFLPVFIWVAWRRRSARPLIMLVVSLVLLNLSVGVVKLATGRIGPLQTSHARDVFVGGDIYPSGHVSNAVVLYGLLALISGAHRRIVTIAAVLLAVEVGLSTVYLDTHWFSDVLGGWIAGGLVLLALPWAMPYAETLWARAWRWLRPRIDPRLPAWLIAWVRAHPAGTHPAAATPAAPALRAGAGPAAAGPAASRPGGRAGSRGASVVAAGCIAPSDPATDLAAAGARLTRIARPAGQAAASPGNETPVNSSASVQSSVAT